MFDIALKRKGEGITMASIYYHCKNAGIEIVSKETKQIKSIIKLSSNKTEAYEKLQEIGLNQDLQIIDKLTPKKNENVFDEIKELIRFENVRFNEITRNYEFNGRPMTDRILAQFYSKCWDKIDEDLAKDKIFTTIENPDNTISYNPIKQFFKENYNLRPIGNIRKLIECFEIDHTTLDENGNTLIANSYLEIFLVKWLLSIIGSAHGTYSLMILVLSGEQRNNKTIFFRELLPEKLRAYYAENSLDEGKDSEILMTKKILIMDDEFGGKSKKDSNKLKRLSSQQTFSVRKPYGRVSEDLERLAVLCGTSNETEIINDPTGNRRIIPVNLISLNVERFRAIDKAELFMELYHIWENDKDGWFLTKEEIQYLNKSTTKNTAVITEEELINKEFEFYEYGKMTNTDVKIFLETKYPMLRTTSAKLGLCLRKLGYKNKLYKIEGKVFRYYQIKQILI
jgi:predicted P-loop ATPase